MERRGMMLLLQTVVYEMNRGGAVFVSRAQMIGLELYRSTQDIRSTVLQ